jgi:hypothetical protein
MVSWRVEVPITLRGAGYRGACIGEKPMTSRWKATCVFAQSTAILLGCAVFPTPAQTPPDQWQFSAILYGYFATLRGSATFPSGTTADITVDPHKILNNLNIAAMGAFELRRGPWGLFTDVMYIDASASKTATRAFSIGNVMIPGSVTANLGLAVKTTVWTLAATYRAVADPELTADILLGARDLDLKQHLTWQFSGDVGPFVGPGRQGSGNSNPNNWDAIVGFKGRATLGAEHAWFVPYYLDLGAGNSDFTWQGVLGLGYTFSSWGEVIVVWKYLDYQFKNNNATLSMSGPAIGIGFYW